MNSERDIHNIIVKVFSGTATDDEKVRVKNWVTQSESNEKLFRDLQEIWDGTESEASRDAFNADDAIHVFLEKTCAPEKDRNITTKRFLRYAAVFVLAISIPFVYWFTKQPEITKNTYTTIHSAYGDKTEVVLPDSSLVWLNSGSQLTFVNDFESDSREVFLTGEAYFSVKKDFGKPFIVNAQEVEVEVFGTEFNFKAYSDEESVSVTLVEGSVQVSHLDEEELLKPGQKILLDKQTNALNISNPEDLAPDVEWIHGRLVFRNQSLNELELTLERWFDVEIEFKDDLVKTRRFSGTLDRESILEVISYFGVSQYVDYSIDGNVITFFSENS